jgi:hypothetical protein
MNLHSRRHAATASFPIGVHARPAIAARYGRRERWRSRLSVGESIVNLKIARVLGPPTPLVFAGEPIAIPNRNMKANPSTQVPTLG